MVWNCYSRLLLLHHQSVSVCFPPETKDSRNHNCTATICHNFCLSHDRKPSIFFGTRFLTRLNGLDRQALNIYVMKKIFNNSRLIAIAFFTVFTAASAPAALAINSKDLPVELKFIGSINSQSIYQLKISGNSTHDDYALTIRDEFGNSIYRENIKAGNFSKKFLSDTEELGDDTLFLEVFCRKTNKSVVYTINRQSQYAQYKIITGQQ